MLRIMQPLDRDSYNHNGLPLNAPPPSSSGGMHLTCSMDQLKISNRMGGWDP